MASNAQRTKDKDTFAGMADTSRSPAPSMCLKLL